MYVQGGGISSNSTSNTSRSPAFDDIHTSFNACLRHTQISNQTRHPVSAQSISLVVLHRIHLCLLAHCRLQGQANPHPGILSGIVTPCCNCNRSPIIALFALNLSALPVFSPSSCNLGIVLYVVGFVATTSPRL